MRVAIVHDFLTQRGGAERVVLFLAQAFEDPVIVTSLYAPEDTYDEFQSLPVRASRSCGTAEARHFRSRLLTYPAAFRSLDLDDAEIVIVSSSSFAHHVEHPRSLVYWHTPPRFLYEPGAYFRSPSRAWVAERCLAPLRTRDRRAALRHLSHAANSRGTRDRLESVYGLTAEVIHPPLDTARLWRELSPMPRTPAALVIARLLPYKRVEVAIAACQSLRLPLTVIGEGPDERRLRRLAGEGTSFLHALSNNELIEQVAKHSVVVCPAPDDFGYVPLEAAYLGRPVVASSHGGAAETVIENETGFLVDGWSVTNWAAAIDRALEREWDVPALREAAGRFDGDVFKERLEAWLSPHVDPSRVMRAGARS